MKITNTYKHKTKLLRLELLRTKIYKRDKEFNYLSLKDIEAKLKKVLHIIYKFHVANKRILFIGTPLKLNQKIKKLLKDKKHNFIPESVWMKGIITNANPSFKHLFKNDKITSEVNSKFLFNLKNPIDLIVILNEELNLNALKESSLKRIPTISFNSNCDFLNLATYKVLGNFNFTKKKNRNNLFYLLLSSLFKKAEVFRKKTVISNLKQTKSQFQRKRLNQLNKRKKW